MEEFFRIFGVYAIVKYLIFITIVSKGYNKSVIEVILTFASLPLFYLKTNDILITIAFVETDIIVANLLLLANVAIIKCIAFRLLVSITHDDSFSKILCKVFNKKRLCKKLKTLQEIDYGPRLKLGIPAMANKINAKTRIRFNSWGFPKFKSYYTIHLKRCDYKKSREYHFNYANKFLYNKALKSKKVKKRFTLDELSELKKGNTPDRYTWHHHQDSGKLQLVSRKINAKVYHIGGYDIWGGGS